MSSTFRYLLSFALTKTFFYPWPLVVENMFREMFAVLSTILFCLKRGITFEMK